MVQKWDDLCHAAFYAGVNVLGAGIANSTNALIQFQRDMAAKTFTDKHGSAQAQRLYRWTNKTDGMNLPGIHKLLAKSHKSQHYSTLESLVQERVAASPIPLAQASQPLAVPKIVDH